MDFKANNLYETASQPDTGNDAYTFLEFNTHDEDYNYPEFQELSQPIRSSVWPTPSDSVFETSDRALSNHQSDASPVFTTSDSSAKARGGGGGVSSSGNQAVVFALAAGMSGLTFEVTGDEENYEYGKGDFTEHTCKYSGVQNLVCCQV